MKNINWYIVWHKFAKCVLEIVSLNEKTNFVIRVSNELSLFVIFITILAIISIIHWFTWVLCTRTIVYKNVFFRTITLASPENKMYLYTEWKLRNEIQFFLFNEYSEFRTIVMYSVCTILFCLVYWLFSKQCNRYNIILCEWIARCLEEI